MSKKVTTKDIEKYIKDNNINIEMLEDYKRSNTAFKYKCNECGEIKLINFGNLRFRGKNCSCNSNCNRQQNTETYKSKIKNMFPDIEVLGEYINEKTPILHKCSIDGYEFMDIPNSMTAKYKNNKLGNGCPKCNSKVRYGIDFVKEMIESANPELKVLSTEYKSNVEPIKIKCKIDGHIFTRVWHNIDNDYKINCPVCTNGNMPMTIDRIRKYLESICGDRIFLLSNDFIRKGKYKKRVLLKCNLCGNEWDSQVENVMSYKVGCNKCGKSFSDLTGWYNSTRAEKYKGDWELIDCSLYVIKCEYEKELFYKIGVTTKSVGERFNRSEFIYSINEILTLNTNLYSAVIIEESLHNKFQDFKYIPSEKFGGWTECFSEVNLEEIKRIINDYKNKE